MALHILGGFRFYALVLVGLLAVNVVTSLECYECFSYESEADCQSRPKMKIKQCSSDKHDTCLKVSMTINPAQKYAKNFEKPTEKVYARYCGRKLDCHQAEACKFPFTGQLGIDVKDCKTLCCDADLSSKCHEAPGWKYWQAGNRGNSTGGNPQAGARGGDASTTRPMYYGLLCLWALAIFVYGHAV